MASKFREQCMKILCRVIHHYEPERSAKNLPFEEIFEAMANRMTIPVAMDRVVSIHFSISWEKGRHAEMQEHWVLIRQMNVNLREHGTYLLPSVP